VKTVGFFKPLFFNYARRQTSRYYYVHRYRQVHGLEGERLGQDSGLCTSKQRNTETSDPEILWHLDQGNKGY
jgi:hypothetical protein